MPGRWSGVRTTECAWGEMACSEDVKYRPNVRLYLCKQHAALVEQDRRDREGCR